MRGRGPEAEDAGTLGQPVRHAVVTHVLGTACNPCLRVVQGRTWREGGSHIAGLRSSFRAKLPSYLLSPPRSTSKAHITTEGRRRCSPAVMHESVLWGWFDGRVNHALPVDQLDTRNRRGRHIVSDAIIFRGVDSRFSSETHFLIPLPVMCPLTHHRASEVNARASAAAIGTSTVSVPFAGRGLSGVIARLVAMYFEIFRLAPQAFVPTYELSAMVRRSIWGLKLSSD